MENDKYTWVEVYVVHDCSRRTCLLIGLLIGRSNSVDETVISSGVRTLYPTTSVTYNHNIT